MKPEKLYIECGCDNITDCVVCNGVGFLESGLHTGQVDSMQNKLDAISNIAYGLIDRPVTGLQTLGHEIRKIISGEKINTCVQCGNETLNGFDVDGRRYCSDLCLIESVNSHYDDVKKPESSEVE